MCSESRRRSIIRDTLSTVAGVSDHWESASGGCHGTITPTMGFRGVGRVRQWDVTATSREEIRVCGLLICTKLAKAQVRQVSPEDERLAEGSFANMLQAESTG